MILHPGNAGSNTATDCSEVLEHLLDQLPVEYRASDEPGDPQPTSVWSTGWCELPVAREPFTGQHPTRTPRRPQPHTHHERPFDVCAPNTEPSSEARCHR